MKGEKKSIAVLGGGPTGLEAALYARKLGYPVTVLEKGGAAGTNIRRWGFVQLFTPWHMNVSPLGLAVLKQSGLSLPPASVCPTGGEFAGEYLQPLADSLGEVFRPAVEVVGIARCGLIKRDAIGGEERAGALFRLLITEAEGGEEELTAEIVIDATGVYDSPVALGDGGLPALGERSAAHVIRYHLVDIAGAERQRFSGKSTLLVGSGFSAATSLLALVEVVATDPGARLIWARRSTDPAPLPVFPDDPLPLRAHLAERANAVAAAPPPRCRVLSGVTVRSVQLEGDGVRVTLGRADGSGLPETVNVDHVVANVGYRPNLDVFRELHVHQCYATEGPMNLAAALLAESGSVGDCLEQSSRGIETVRNPEPAFFILGSKSYGRRSDFLLRVGREQIRDLFRYLEDDPDLDLYRESYA